MSTYSTVIQVPVNCSSITLSDGVHVPSAGLVTDASDADATILVDSFNAPRIISSVVSTGVTTISMPSNVSAITINSVAYTPDGTQYNVIAGPDADMTLVVEQGFVLVDSAATS